MELEADSTSALYDDPDFFMAYDEMRMRDGTVNEVIEFPALVSLFPEIAGVAVADLGCGMGAMCRWLVAHGAASVTGFDDSERMLSRAREQSPGMKNLRYERSPLELVDLAPTSFDLVISGLALHYVSDFASAARRVSGGLRPGGCFIFSVEHPIITCSRRESIYGDDGSRAHWPVDRYLDEGGRTMCWMGFDNVPRQHRTISSYVNGLIDSGLVLRRLLEPAPNEEAIEKWPRLADQRRRPPFLVVRADRPD